MQSITRRKVMTPQENSLQVLFIPKVHEEQNRTEKHVLLQFILVYA